MSVGCFFFQSRCTVLAASLALLFSAARAQVTVTWGGSGGSWNTGTNWLGSLLPGASDTAQINSGSPTVNNAVSIANLTFSGGNIGGAATLTLTGTGSVWSGGSMNGTGTLTIQSGAALAISTNTHDFNQRAIVNNGTLTWSGGTLRTGSGGSITNNGTFTDTASDSLQNAFGGALGFTNAGTYNKNAAGTTTIGLSFANSGTVNVNSGTLNLNAGGSDASGAKLNVASGAALAFSSGSFTFASAADLVDSGGAYFVSGGNLSFAAGTLTLPALTLSGGSLGFTTGGLTLTTLALSGGSLGGAGSYTVTNLTQTGGSINGSGNVTLTGPGSTWSGGDMNGTGTLTIQSGAALAISTNTHDFNQRAIVNNGTLTWSGGTLRTGSGGSITNNGTFTDTASDSLQNAFGGALGFTNAGTYNKNAAGTTTIGLSFANSGTVNVNSGTLNLNAGGSSSANFATASGATTIFSNSYTLSSGATLTGLGQYTQTGGTLTIAGATTVTNFAQSGGTIAINGTLSLGNFLMTGGNVSGTGTLNVSGPFTWSGTTLNGPGIFNANGGISLIGNVSIYNAQTLNLAGTSTWSGGTIYEGTGAILNNAGTFNLTSNDSFYNYYGGTRMTLNNSGTLTKSGGTGTSNIDAVFNNTGSVSVSTGTLEFAGTFAQSGSSSTLKVSNGATLRFDQSGGLALAAGSLIGSGNVVGNVTSSGVISPSSSSFNPAATPGQLNLTGDLSLLAVSSLLFELGSGTKPGTDYDFIAVSGATALGGAQLNVGLTSGFSAAAGQTFTLLTASGGLSGTFANVPNGQILFVNGGSFLVNYGAGSAFATNSLVLSNFVPVPEPATWTLLLAGCGTLLISLRRRKS